MRGKGVRRRYAQGLSVISSTDRAKLGSDGLETVVHDRKQPGAGVRQRYGSRSATKKCRSAMLFQQANLVADGCRCDAKFGRGLLEAEMPCDRLKCAQLDK